MDQKHFRGILNRYLRGTATAKERDIIEAWFAAMGKDSEQLLAEQDEAALEEKYWSHIDAHIARQNGRRIIPWGSVGLAASLLMAVMVSLYLVFPRERAGKKAAQKTGPDKKWEQITNTSDVARQFILADGSRVLLEPRSKLGFKSGFDDRQRSVYLEGEAFFDVQRDEERPFIVNTKQVTTKVLGTSFRVRAFEDARDVVVTVKTGRVAVVTHKDEEADTRSREVILTPNQEMVFNTEENEVSRKIVADPEPIVEEEEVRRMRFYAAPVVEIFEAIEKVYGVDLVYDPTDFASCNLTSVISDGGLFNRLDIICDAIGGRYEVKEDRIVIRGTGCTTYN